MVRQRSPMGPTTIHGCGKPARPVSPEVSGDVIPFDADRRSAHQRRAPGRLTQTFSPLLSSKGQRLAESVGQRWNHLAWERLGDLIENTQVREGWGIVSE